MGNWGTQEEEGDGNCEGNEEDKDHEGEDDEGMTRPLRRPTCEAHTDLDAKFMAEWRSQARFRRQNLRT